MWGLLGDGWLGAEKERKLLEGQTYSPPPKIWPESTVAFMGSSQEAHKTCLSSKRRNRREV